jgi:F420-dependent oxidoreductase-like protein
MMKTAISIGGANSGRGQDWAETVRYAVECERLGVDFCWSAEAWGQDAVVPLAYVAARTERIRLGTGIMQISARVPSMTAMTALTLAGVSDGRFVLGLGVSGPQVVEGLHGVSFAHPVDRLREYVDIVRLAFDGRVLEYEGEHFRLPSPGGEGKALRLAQVSAKPIPLYIAALGPVGLELTGERADGWIGTCFVAEAAQVYFDPMRRGLQRSGRTMADLDLQAGGPVGFEEDGDSLSSTVSRDLAFRLGAMGSRQHNFYNLAYQRAGFGEEAQKIQQLWLDGHREEARQAVTDEMVRVSALVGTEVMVTDRLRALRDAGITTVRLEPVGATTSERLDTVAHVLDLVRALDDQVRVAP